MKTDAKRGNWILRSIHHVSDFVDMKWVLMPTDRIVGMMYADGSADSDQYINESLECMCCNVHNLI